MFSELVLQIRRYGSSASRYLMKTHNFSSHYLISYYTTHRPDGVHIEAHCTCGEKLEEQK